MRVDEEGRIWFERNDKVRPKTVARYNSATGQHEYFPHEKPIGGIKVVDGEIVERKLEDSVRFVDKQGSSQQIQLASWLQAAQESESDGGGGEKSSWRTRWEPSDWYELVVPDAVKIQKPKVEMDPFPKRAATKDV